MNFDHLTLIPKAFRITPEKEWDFKNPTISLPSLSGELSEAISRPKGVAAGGEVIYLVYELSRLGNKFMNVEFNSLFKRF